MSETINEVFEFQSCDVLSGKRSFDGYSSYEVWVDGYCEGTTGNAVPLSEVLYSEDHCADAFPLIFTAVFSVPAGPRLKESPRCQPFNLGSPWKGQLRVACLIHLLLFFKTETGSGFLFLSRCEHIILSTSFS